jgi:hypothetical protein
VIIEIKIEAQDLLVVGSSLAVWCAHWVTTGGANTITLKKKIAHISIKFFFLSMPVLFHTMSPEKERTFVLELYTYMLHMFDPFLRCAQDNLGVKKVLAPSKNHSKSPIMCFPA